MNKSPFYNDPGENGTILICKINPRNSNEMHMGYEDDAYLKTDNGKTSWTDQSEGIKASYGLSDLELDFSTGSRFIATVNGSVLRWSSNSTVSIQKITFNKGVKVYPNPANDIVNIKMEETKTIEAIALYNLSGTIFMNENFENKQSQTQLNITKTPQGVYLLKILDNDKKFLTNKLIINR